MLKIDSLVYPTPCGDIVDNISKLGISSDQTNGSLSGEFTDHRGNVLIGLYSVFWQRFVGNSSPRLIDDTAVRLEIRWLYVEYPFVDEFLDCPCRIFVVCWRIFTR